MFLLVLTQYLNSMFEYKSIIDNIIVIELNVRLNTEREFAIYLSSTRNAKEIQFTPKNCWFKYVGLSENSN